MAALHDLHVPIGADLRRAGVGLKAHFALCKGEIKLFHGLGVQAQGRVAFGYQNGERVEDLIDLDRFLGLEHGELFRIFADGGGLNETGGARGGGRDDCAGDLVLAILRDWQRVVPVFHGNEAVRAELLVAFQKLLHAGLDLFPRVFHLAADVPQVLRRVGIHLAAGDAAMDLQREFLKRVDHFAPEGEGHAGAFCLFEISLQPLACRGERRDGQKLCGQQQTSLFG